ncbi:MAG: STAS domain-containing protein [Mycobacterium sp.]
MTSNARGVGGAAATPTGCDVAERWVGDTCVLEVSGVVDMVTLNQFEAAIEAAAKKTPTALVVDMSDIDFLASSGINALVVAFSELTPAIQFVVVADGPATSRPLRVLGIADLIDLFATLDEALAAVKPA